MGLWHHEQVARPLSATIAVSVLNLAVGGLFLFRDAEKAKASLFDLLLCLPSLLISAGALTRSGKAWPLISEIGFGLGALFALTSLLFLGRSFAIFPALRGVVAEGPYRLVRHPAYASELLMLLSTLLALALRNELGPEPGPETWSGPLEALALGLFGVAALVLRIRIEEKLLLRDTGYQAYAERVRYRLVPGLW